MEDYKDTMKALESRGYTSIDDWLRFSNVQAASCLVVDDESCERFGVWLQTRSPENAWS